MNSIAAPARTTLSPEPNLLTPEDAYYSSPSRKNTGGAPSKATKDSGSLSGGNSGVIGNNIGGGTGTANGNASRGRRSRSRLRSSRNSSSNGGSTRWKKLLWIKQPYPDNYTDASTFLSHLKRPPLQAYDFWPLVADSSVIVQHVCAVALFVCCFVGIYQDRVSPTSVVGTATAATVVGWVMWDIWLGRDEQEREKHAAAAAAAASGGTGGGSAGKINDDLNGLATGDDAHTMSNSGFVNGYSAPASAPTTPGLGISTPGSMAGSSMPPSNLHSRNQSSTSLFMYGNISTSTSHPPVPSLAPSYPPYHSPTSLLSPRNQQRLATAKSALLIYLALLGLSPILRTLTYSTTSDSIWAMSGWLLLTNILTFDYGSSSGPSPSSQSTSSTLAATPSSSPPTSLTTTNTATISTPPTHFPASLSTNAALMASTVLASRLPSTAHVFSLTLFSIEVFGLFPVFRRYLRNRSFALHVLLTVLLILGSGAGLGITLMGRPVGASNADGGDGAGGGIFGGGLAVSAFIGASVWSFGAIIAMGGCSWWLIGLQRYKNVVTGPWDPARPIIRAGAWD